MSCLQKQTSMRRIMQVFALKKIMILYKLLSYRLDTLVQGSECSLGNSPLWKFRWSYSYLFM